MVGAVVACGCLGVCVRECVQVREEVFAVVGWAAAGRTVPGPRVTTNPCTAQKCCEASQIATEAVQVMACANHG